MWSSDDRSITFQRDGRGLLSKVINGAEAPEQLIVEHKHGILPAAWLNAGRTLLYNAVDPEKGMGAFAFSPADGTIAEIGPRDLHPATVAVSFEV